MSTYEMVKWGLNLTELIACIAGFYSFKKIKNSHWKYFPFYLALIFLIEMSAKGIRTFTANDDFVLNMYNYFGIPIQFLFFFWLFYQHDKSLKIKSWAIIGTIVYLISIIVDELFVKNEILFSFKSMPYTCGNIVLSVLIFRYFYHLTKSDELLYFKEKQMFWVCLGLMIFYLGTIPYYGLFNTLRLQYQALFQLYWFLQMFLNMGMYLCFTISFLWSKSK